MGYERKLQRKRKESCIE